MQNDRVEAFTNFAQNCLQMATKKPLHKTHIILVSFSFDFGLGQVKSLEGYQRLPLEEARASLGLGADGQHPMVNFQDLDNSPMLQQSRFMRPYNQLLLVAFYSKPAGVLFLSPNMTERFPDICLISALKS